MESPIAVAEQDIDVVVGPSDNEVEDSISPEARRRRAKSNVYPVADAPSKGTVTIAQENVDAAHPAQVRYNGQI